MKLIKQLTWWLNAWCDLIDSLIGIFTFGFYWTNLGMKIRIWQSKKFLKWNK
jgi:hypothetical protein